MSPLERRCRLLMRAYPAGYRRERGDEIIATLLEATPEGRRRPLARDMRALIMGGLRARAAQHRGLTTAVNLRLAVMAGVCIYLGTVAEGDLDRFVAGEVDRAVPALGSSGWPVLPTGLLMAVVVAVAWLARRWPATGPAQRWPRPRRRSGGTARRRWRPRGSPVAVEFERSSPVLTFTREKGVADVSIDSQAAARLMREIRLESDKYTIREYRPWVPNHPPV